MAKMGMGMGGAPAGGMPRPMPNPRLNPAAAAPAAAPKPAGGGLFGAMPMQKRFDMAMELLKNGTAMAAQSNSPLAQFLAPLASAAIGGGIENKRAKMAGAENDELMAAMMPGANQEELARLSAITANPDAPAHLKAIAKAKLDAAIKPFLPVAPGKGGGGGGGGGKGKSSGGGGGGGKPKQKLYGEYNINGVLHGRNAYGEMIPYTDGKGTPVSTGKGSGPAEPAPPGAPGGVVIDGYTIEEIE